MASYRLTNRMNHYNLFKVEGKVYTMIIDKKLQGAYWDGSDYKTGAAILTPRWQIVAIGHYPIPSGENFLTLEEAIEEVLNVVPEEAGETRNLMLQLLTADI